MISMFHSDNLSSTIQSGPDDEIVSKEDPLNSVSDDSRGRGRFHSKTSANDSKNATRGDLILNINIPPTPQQPGRKSKKGRSQPETLVQKQLNMIQAVERAHKMKREAEQELRKLQLEAGWDDEMISAINKEQQAGMVDLQKTITRE